MELATPPSPFMENSINNFHFVFWNFPLLKYNFPFPETDFLEKVLILRDLHRTLADLLEKLLIFCHPQGAPTDIRCLDSDILLNEPRESRKGRRYLGRKYCSTDWHFLKYVHCSFSELIPRWRRQLQTVMRERPTVLLAGLAGYTRRRAAHAH